MIHIKVPATSANIGPGFDTLGLALELYHEISVKPGSTQENTIHWSHPEQSLIEGNNLVAKGIQSAFDYFDSPAIPYELTMINCEVPASRGLGSSAAAYVSGVAAGLYLLGKSIDRDMIFKLASILEGHPDNVAPSVYGGLTASCMAGESIVYQPITLGKPLDFVALIPDYTLSTAEARSILPGSYSRSEAVYNLSRLSILITALQNGNFHLLRTGTQDVLHQPHRLSLMADSNLLVALSQSQLLYGGFVSGAGSTYMLMCSPESLDDVVALAEKTLSLGQATWKIRPLKLEMQGITWEVR